MHGTRYSEEHSVAMVYSCTMESELSGGASAPYEESPPRFVGARMLHMHGSDCSAQPQYPDVKKCRTSSTWHASKHKSRVTWPPHATLHTQA
jgi:hypothetical protein